MAKKKARKKTRLPYKGLKIGPRTDMAIRFMAITFDSDRPVTMQQAANKLNSSVSNLEDLVRKLKKKALIVSRAGPTGGYSLGLNPYDITLANIIVAIEGQQKAENIIGQVVSDIVMGPLEKITFADTLERVASIEEQ